MALPGVRGTACYVPLTQQQPQGQSWADEVESSAAKEQPSSGALPSAHAHRRPHTPPGTPAPATSDSTTGAPPGLEPPPGFESLAAQIASVTVRPWVAAVGVVHLTDRTAAYHQPPCISFLQVGDGTVDDPDVAIKGGGLRDPETEITAKSDTLYSSAHSFEELGLSPQLLQGLYTEMKFEKPSKIQAKTLPMILTPPYKSMIAQVLGCLRLVDDAS